MKKEKKRKERRGKKSRSIEPKTEKSEHAKAKEKLCDKVEFVQICFYSGAITSRAETKCISLGEIYSNTNRRAILLSSSLPTSRFGACASIISLSLSASELFSSLHRIVAPYYVGNCPI